MIGIDIDDMWDDGYQAGIGKSEKHIQELETERDAMRDALYTILLHSSPQQHWKIARAVLERFKK